MTLIDILVFEGLSFGLRVAPPGRGRGEAKFHQSPPVTAPYALGTLLLQ